MRTSRHISNKRGPANGVGDIATGQKDGRNKTVYVYNICDHEDAYAETGNQAVSYTTGVPAMIGAAMMMTGAWRGEGVFNIEQLDPDPFMDMLNKHCLPWQVKPLLVDHMLVTGLADAATLVISELFLSSWAKTSYLSLLPKGEMGICIMPAAE